MSAPSSFAPSERVARRGVLVLGFGLAAMFCPASTVQGWPLGDGGHEALARSRALLARAGAALAVGDVDAAEAVVIEVTLGLTDPHNPISEPGRASLTAYDQRLAQRILAARSLAKALASRDLAQTALVAARAIHPLSVAAFDATLAATTQCRQAATPTGADVDWPVPPSGTRLADLATECDHIAATAQDERAAAQKDTLARAATIRGLIRGDRLAVFEEHGEPAGGGNPVDVAHARTWHFVEGPIGPLHTYDTWTFDFSGDTVISIRRVTTHDAP